MVTDSAISCCWLFTKKEGQFSQKSVDLTKQRLLRQIPLGEGGGNFLQQICFYYFSESRAFGANIINVANAVVFCEKLDWIRKRET